MVNRASMNAKANGLTNAVFKCGNLADETALSTLNLGQFSKIIIRPTKNRALEIVKQLNQSTPAHIVYVSCNPATLARDADILVNEQSYKLIAVGVWICFPIRHVESIALFKR